VARISFKRVINWEQTERTVRGSVFLDDPIPLVTVGWIENDLDLLRTREDELSTVDSPDAGDL